MEVEKRKILQITGISKSFLGVKALQSVDLEVYEGEVLALIGENGAGKSTLMKILLGLYQADSGQIYFAGEKVHFNSPNDALNRGISMIHQEISLVPLLDVAENVWMGREEKFTKGGIINSALRHEKTQELFNSLGLKIDTHKIVHSLSVAEMQLVEIARAISYDSRLIIMDEPTSSLSETEVKALYRIIKDLACKGVAIIFISHKIEEIYEICNRIAVMRDGKMIGVRSADLIAENELIQMIAGRELADIYPENHAEISDVVLEVKNLTKYGVFQNINFCLKKGEILGFSGLVGAGRTEIMRTIFGLDKYDCGEIRLDGEVVHIASPHDAIENGIGMITEDRHKEGIFPDMSVLENMTMASFEKLRNKLGVIQKRTEIKNYEEQVSNMDISMSSRSQFIKFLSGGNQQKVIIARWLLATNKILIMDEPTRGIDVGAKSEIYKLIVELAEKGMAIIMISSEMPEIIGLCNRVIVLRNGEITGEFEKEDISQEKLASCSFGLKGENL